MLPREVIESAIRRTSSPEQAADLIEKYERARARVVERSRKVAMMRSQTEGEIRKLMEEKICDHPLRKTHGDPSGGTDRSEECLVCGECLHQREVRFT